MTTFDFQHEKLGACAVVITDGVARWARSGNVIPADRVAAVAAQAPVTVDPAACDAARDADLKAVVTAHKARGFSAAQRAEIRAEVPNAVDVFTGGRIG